MEHVAGELVGAGAPQEGLRAFTLLLLSGSQGLFVDLYSFWGGEIGVVGDEEGCGAQA